MPTLTRKPKPDELVVALYSFAGHDVTVAQGARFRGDSEIVQRFPERFVPENTDDAELARLRAEAAASLPPAEPIGRVGLRVLPVQGGSPLTGGRNQEVMQGGRIFNSGDTLEAEGKDAQYLIDSGICEVVKHLRPKAQPKQSSGRFQTGRTADE